MKPFVLWKLPLILLGLGAALMLTPACKAQAEIDPDHFDGTDSWQVAANRQALSVKGDQKKRPGGMQAQNRKADSGASLRLAASRESSPSAHHDVLAVQDKRKTAIRKSDKK